MQANDDGRRTITLRTGKLHELANEAEAALITADVPFYVRGGDVVRPIVEDVPASKGRRAKVARLKSRRRGHDAGPPLPRGQVREIQRACEKMVAVDPPHDVAKTLLARDGDWRLRPSKGDNHQPNFAPGWQHAGASGYDSATALLLVEPPQIPAIPERPTREDAFAAVRLLDALLCDFPFVNAPSRSVALSALMTPVARGAMQVVPLHAFDAPEAGSGKSYLVDHRLDDSHWRDRPCDRRRP